MKDNYFSQRAAEMMRKVDQEEQSKLLAEQMRRERAAFVDEVIRQESYRAWWNVHGQSIPPRSCNAQYIFDPTPKPY